MRRSQNSKLFLPLDLHVLSLPLAFILSQDQTLHRIFLIIYRRFAWLYSPILSDRQCSLFFFCQSNMSMNVSFFLVSVSLSREAGAKVEILFDSCKLFLKFFSRNFHSLKSFQSAGFYSGFPLVRGAKVSRFFVSGKLFGKKILSLSFFSCLHQILRTSPLLRVQKYTLFPVLQAFRRSFFIFFFVFILRCWKLGGCGGKFFFVLGRMSFAGRLFAI